MRIIRTALDLKVLSDSGVLLNSLMEYLSQEFENLNESLSDSNETMDDFSLDQHGYMVILETGDNLRDLSIVGLSRKHNGLLSSWPEYVELVQLDGLAVYRIAILYTNDYMMFFYSPVGIHDQELESWLSEQCDYVTT